MPPPDVPMAPVASPICTSALPSLGLWEGAVEAEPTQINTQTKPHFVEVHKDKLTVSYVGKGNHTDFGAVQSNHPAPSRRVAYYFEVKVLDAGTRGNICVGLSDKTTLLNRQPGQDQNSYGYQGETGKKFCGNGQKGEAYGPPYGKNDTVGCGIHYTKGHVFFTLNGKHLGRASGLGPSEYYPTVGLHSPGEKVQFNFTGPFMFDLQTLIQGECQEERRIISREQVSTRMLHDLVRSYLLHAGFHKTLRAFERTSSSADTDVTMQDAPSPSPFPPSGPSLLANGPSKQIDTDTGMHDDTPRDRRRQPDDAHQPSAAPAAAAPAAAAGAGSSSRACSIDEDEQRAVGVGDGEGGVGARTLSGLAVAEHALRKLRQTVVVRQSIRRAICSGRIPEAIEIINQHFPRVLTEQPPSLAVVLVVSQQIVELIQRNDVKGALSWLRQECRAVRDGTAHAKTALEETAALIAYRDPERSPLAHHFDPSRRQLAADLINQHIIERELGLSGWAPLHVLVRQVVAARRLLFERNLSRGPYPHSRHLCQAPLYQNNPPTIPPQMQATDN